MPNKEPWNANTQGNRRHTYLGLSHADGERERKMREWRDWEGEIPFQSCTAERASAKEKWHISTTEPGNRCTDIQYSAVKRWKNKKKHTHNKTNIRFLTWWYTCWSWGHTHLIEIPLSEIGDGFVDLQVVGQLYVLRTLHHVHTPWETTIGYPIQSSSSNDIKYRAPKLNLV